MVLFSLNFNDQVVAIVNIVIILYILLEIIAGYKKGFLESSIRFLGFILAIIGAYILKNPLSVLMYTHLPFFKLGGLFKGVSALNIIIYELIAFILVFIVLMVVIKIIAKLTGLVDRLLSLIFMLGIPGKILGAIVGFIKALVILYFVLFFFRFGCNLFGYRMKDSLATDIGSLPVLNQAFGDTLNSLDEITSLALEYEDTKDKDEFNQKTIDILLKYKVITEDNLQILIDNGKIKVDYEGENDYVKNIE